MVLCYVDSLVFDYIFVASIEMHFINSHFYRAHLLCFFISILFRVTLNTRIRLSRLLTLSFVNHNEHNDCILAYVQLLTMLKFAKPQAFVEEIKSTSYLPSYNRIIHLISQP